VGKDAASTTWAEWVNTRSVLMVAIIISVDAARIIILRGLRSDRWLKQRVQL